MPLVRKIRQRFLTVSMLIFIFYYVGTAIVGYTLFQQHQMGSTCYLAYPVLMLLAFHAKQERYKNIAGLASLALFFIGGLLEPLSIDNVEEAFILVPLLYLVLYPATIWPILICVLLISSYLLDLEPSEFGEFIEDAIELILITSFATVMVYFQRQANIKSAHFKLESETDFLTQVGNRKAFYLHLTKIKLLDHPTSPHVLLQINIDNFRGVNEQFGQNIGDQLLKNLCKKLDTLTNNNIKLYRTGGDLFSLILFAQTDQKSEATSLAESILEITKQSASILNRTHTLTSSIGITHFQDSENQVDMWCRNAELAISSAKKQGGGCYAWFDQKMLERKARRYLIEKELESALEKHQFSLVYQPKVKLDKGKFTDVEALIRWNHPTLGFISPAEFIPISEGSQKIVTIGEWVINQACEQGKYWLDRDMAISISVNVSTVQFSNCDLFSTIKDALFRTGFPGKLLQIEITETAIMNSYTQIVETCQKLRTLGIRIAIDDFGVDYSCLNYLRRLPIDVLKIDKSFVDDCVEDPKAHMLIRTIIQLGHNLNLIVTAEGVETDMQCSLLASEGCDKYQGYLYSKPVAPEALEILFSTQEAPLPHKPETTNPLINK